MKGCLSLAVLLGLGLGFKAAAVAPIIKTQPASIIVSAAATARFSDQSTNTAPLTYQWQFKGTNMAGSTNSTLVLDNVLTNQAGSYTLSVSSTNGTVKSSVATLTVRPGTLIKLHVTGIPGDLTNGDMVVQLFDYDKPATVQNFIHYIVSGCFNNLFIDRMIPGFVLQSGDFDTADRTNTQSFFNLSSDQPTEALLDIFASYTSLRTRVDSHGTVEYAFPFQIDNEFGRGARVNNSYGTLAMGQVGGDPDSAANGWYINLTNNVSLDSENGQTNVGYTVFGRVVSGSNVLEYFNGLRKPDGGIFDISLATTNISSLTDLPVRYNSTNLPSDADLYFIDFTNLTPLTIDNTPPGPIRVISPAPGARVHGTLTEPRTVTFTGTATDNIGLARVVLDITSINGGIDLLGGTSGTTNWSLTFPGVQVGLNRVIVTAQDGNGYQTHYTNYFVVTTPLTVRTNGNGTTTAGLDGKFLEAGLVYSITATPKPGNIFSNWTFGNQSILTPTFNFRMSEGTTMTANFMTNNLAGGLSFFYPAANAKLSNTDFTLSGKIKTGVTLTNVLCQFYDSNGKVTTNGLAAISATNWTLSTHLEPGSYTVMAVAADVNGKTTLISESFTILTPLHVIKVGNGTLTPNRDGQYVQVGTAYSITATPSNQWLFATWSDGVNSSTNPVVGFYMTTGYTLTATFVTNYYPNLLGTYNGLFYNTNTAAAASSGAFSITLTPAASGAFSGKLMSLGKTFTFNGKFDYTGNTRVTVARAGTDAVTLFLTLDLTNGTGTVTGLASNANWTANLLGYRAVTKLGTNTVPAAGNFVLKIPASPAATNSPGGDSYATFTTSAAGALTLTGKLADNLSTAVISESTGVSTNGLWPFFASAANGTEVVFGWQTFSSPNNCSGPLQWIKGATVATTYYPAGFSISNNAAGEQLVQSLPGSYQITFSGGTLTAPVTDSITMNAAHQFVVAGTPADKLSITLTPATGAFTGHFINPTTQAALNFQGAFTFSDLAGFGCVLDLNHQTGLVVIRGLK